MDRSSTLRILASTTLLLTLTCATAQAPTVARQWKRQLLEAIKRDFARPPIHARNLFHVSAAMYDAWSAYEPGAEPYLLGRTRGTYTCAFDGVAIPSDAAARRAAQEEAMGFASYRIIRHRFLNSPGISTTLAQMNSLMDDLGYDRNNVSTDYINGGAAELGNYIAQEFIAFGFTDGSNEVGNFGHLYYQPINPPIEVEEPGNPLMIDPNRWQQITLTNAIDQTGNPVVGTPPPIGHEWGNVVPFSLDPSSMQEFERDGNIYKVYHDPGPPALLDTLDPGGMDSFYKWNFVLVSIWQSHLDPDDPVVWDISPGTSGNIQAYPTNVQEYYSFYDLYNGGVAAQGFDLNPITGEPYAPQLVKRGDFARILAEFWADGPQSETPPGHWFSIMHDVIDHPQFERRWMGQGEILDPLEFDVKVHLAMGGAMHDAAMTAWSIKGWYDYVRPVSAIRYMGDRGQCSDPMLPNYHPAGLPIIPSFVEQVEEGDDLAGAMNEHVGKMKLHTWRGPGYIDDPDEDYAGVGWILAENWWPYQRPTFVTPPFAGYISGHSTYSSTAAEVLERITGSSFFPGGLSNYYCPQDEFLEFETGPSQDVFLQWATYRDAADQCSLSRIWGGIHPPIDDIPGRLLGVIVGEGVVDLVNELIISERPVVTGVVASSEVLNIDNIGSTFHITISYDRALSQDAPPTITYPVDDPLEEAAMLFAGQWLNDSTYRYTYTLLPSTVRLTDVFVRIDGAVSAAGIPQDVHLADRPFLIDTDRPEVVGLQFDQDLINDAAATVGMLNVIITFSEPCDEGVMPSIAWIGADLDDTLIPDVPGSQWIAPDQFRARFQVVDNNEEIAPFGIQISGHVDLAGNAGSMLEENEVLSVDTRNPIILDVAVSDDLLTQQDAGGLALIITLTFDEEMDLSVAPSFSFPDDNPMGSSLFLNPANSFWINPTTYQRAYNLLIAQEEFFDITVALVNFFDLAGNTPVQTSFPQLFSIDTRRPTVSQASPSVQVVSDSEVGAGGFTISILYDEPMDQTQAPLVQLTGAPDLGGSFTPAPGLSSWMDPHTFVAAFNVIDQGREVDGIGITVGFARDQAGNSQIAATLISLFDLDTRNPELTILTANTYNVTNTFGGEGGLVLISLYDEAMDQGAVPLIDFTAAEDVDAILQPNVDLSDWLNNFTYRSAFDVANVDASFGPVAVMLSNARDLAGNLVQVAEYPEFLNIDLMAVGIDKLQAGAQVMVHPNPLLQGMPLLLTASSDLVDVELLLHDAQGRLVAPAIRGTYTTGTHTIHLPALASGAYSLRLVGREHENTMRLLVVEH
jgi:hypothetical protein